MIIQVRKKTRPVIKELINNGKGFQIGNTLGGQLPSIETSSRKILEQVMHNYLLATEDNGNQLVTNVAREVRRTKPEKILDLAMRLLPKEVVTSSEHKPVAPIIINQQFVGDDIKKAPNTVVVDGAVVDD